MPVNTIKCFLFLMLPWYMSYIDLQVSYHLAYKQPPILVIAGCPVFCSFHKLCIWFASFLLSVFESLPTGRAGL